MGLYPDLNTVLNSSHKKPDFKKSDRLVFSSASQATTNFETINDKVLREMNERAKKQLENRIEPAVNPFKLGDTSSKSRSPQRVPPSGRKRFSLLHSSQFKRMESIESHPKVVAKNSRMNLRKEFAKEHKEPKESKPSDGPSPGKRGQVKAEESPTKRLRQAPASESRTLRSTSSKVSLRPQTSKTTLRPESKEKKVPEPAKADIMKRSETSERIRARASMRNLRGPTLARPDMKELPRELTTAKPTTNEMAERAPRSIRQSMSSRDLRGSRLSSRVIQAPSTPDAMDMDTSTISEDSPSSKPPIPLRHTRSARKLSELPSVPKHTPSYARPTAATVRRSQSQHTLRGGQHEPSRVASMLGTLSRVPRKNPDAKR